MAMEPLLDGHGRRIGDLRVSVTDRCNFRCQYCMPAEGLPWLERDELLHFEEIERLVAPAGRDGRHRRAPDRRRAARAPRLPARWSRCSPPLVEDLEHHAPTATCSSATPRRSCAAGATRFNVSIDSLQRDRFFEMTRRDALPRVLRGLEVLAGFPEAHPIKVNAVAMRGFTEDEVLPFARFAREHPYEVRFIEFMPLDADHAWTPDSVLSGEEIRAIDRASAGRSSPSRASRTPPRASTASPTAAARSASSTRSPSRSAATATASA